MTTTHLATSPVAEAVAALADEQWRVAGLLAAASVRDRETTQLRREDRWWLVRRGHFPLNAAELDWTPRDVAGHLRDSAAVFTERLTRLRGDTEPRFGDFVPAEPARVAGYAAIPFPLLVAELRRAQADLLTAVADIEPGDLQRAGVLDLLRFLPAHQRDHAEQLTALLRR